jgi:uncharacterized iron-regulated protein
MWGCTVLPKKLYIKDISKSFEESTIISAKTGMSLSFSDLMADLAGVRVIYVGEQHTDPAHHSVQLRVIKELFRKHPNVSVGMEMFDRTYQPVLDLWSAGKLDRKAFLEKVHWYANWRFDYDLYSDIFDFIKENKIRLVALNIPSHIPPKIREGGIENLSIDEKKHLPAKINTSNAKHREYVEPMFKHHPFSKRVNFDYFYLAQCVWEDTMAESIAANLKGEIMVVLAGNGHIIRKFGIPDRAYTLTMVPFRTLYPASSGSRVELDYADYIWVTPSHKKGKKMKTPSAKHPGKSKPS